MEGRTIQCALLVALVSIVIGATILVLTPQGRDALVAGVMWLRAAGMVGKIAALGLVVVGIPLGLPTLWFAAMLGFLFGPAIGIPLALVAIPAGATTAFLATRAVLLYEVRRRLMSRPKAAAIMHAVSGGGARLIALLRIAGPHNLLNAVFAASDVSLRSFVVGTAIGSVPSVALAAFGGAMAPNADALWDARKAIGNWWIPIAIAGLVTLVWSVRLVQAAAKAELAKHAPLD